MAEQQSPVVPALDNAACWRKLPATSGNTSGTLPLWARAVAVHLPRTAAAMLQLDWAQRRRSPLDPALRAKLRWLIARANQCVYSQRTAPFDLSETGVSAWGTGSLAQDPAPGNDLEREAFEFVRLLTTAAPTIPDELFAALRYRVGDRQVAAMVLLAAYGNFQDRILLGLGLQLEADGPLPPLEVDFGDALQLAVVIPEVSPPKPFREAGEMVVEPDAEWGCISFEELQSRLESQRSRTPRLPIPTWDEVRPKLPPAMQATPTRIVWNLVCSGYVPELAVPWSICTRTIWAEFPTDRIFEENLFWIQTRAVGCNYCMGHCEMLLESSGFDKAGVAEWTRWLASDDWSKFPPAQQRAFAYARTLSRRPWELTAADYRQLESDFGPAVALATFWWLCRGLYMTRVSDGFQLPLERENVFADYGPKK